MKGLYPDDETVNLIKKISENGNYERNGKYPIEHTLKVILYSDILAKGEKLNDEEKRLLLTAAAFHDGGIGKIETSEYDENYMKQKSSIIQTAIEYNEFREYPVGQINEEKIKRIGTKYQLPPKELKTTEKISMLLKDAYLLDNKFMRDRVEYLHSDTAKQKEIIDFADMIDKDISREKETIQKQGGEQIPVEKVLQIFMKEKDKDYKGYTLEVNRFFNMNGVKFDEDELKRVNDGLYKIFKSEDNEDKER